MSWTEKLSTRLSGRLDDVTHQVAPIGRVANFQLRAVEDAGRRGPPVPADLLFQHCSKRGEV